MTENVLDINTRKRIVYGEGPKDAKIMVIGEAPGAKEDKLGKPFVGKAGQALDSFLFSAGIIRSQCYLTNVVKERPPSNNIKKFIELKKGKAKIKEGYNKYEDYLLDEIREVNPNIILVTGAVPLYAVCRLHGITKWRGSITTSATLARPDGNPYKVLPILHPASTFRQHIWQHYIKFDLRKLRSESQFPEIKRKTREYIIEPSYLQALEFIEECKKHKHFGFDIEVSYREVSCISLAYNDQLAISIPFLKGGREYFSPDQEFRIWQEIGKILEDPEIESIGQNVTFDSTFLFRKYGIKTRNVQDTMIAMAINYPDFQKDLGFITSIYTDMEYYKDERKESFNKGELTDTQAFWIYNAKDSIVLMEAFPKMVEELRRLGNIESYENQRRLIEPLLYMTERGIKMDTQGLRERSREVGEKMEKLKEEINSIIGYEINPNSPPQLMEHFYGDKRDGGLGIKPYLKNGRPTTNEGALVRLARGTKQRPGLDEASLILEFRGLSKMKGTYLDMSLDTDARVRCSMNPVGTRTGRLSSSKTIFGTGGNLQNQPPLMKEYMLTDKDYVCYEIDLGQAENRVVAYIAPEPKMIEAFEKDIDIHSRTASLIFNIPEDEVRDMHDEDVKCEEIGTGDYTHRFWGKKANHAFNYKQGYKKFAYQVEIPEFEGKKIYNGYHSAYPGVRMYHNWVESKLSKDRKLTNLFGRTYIFYDRWGNTLLQAATAFIPQSTVADIINRRGINHVYYNQDLFDPVEILNQVHDSIVFQISKKYPLKTHVECILNMAKKLQTQLSFRGRDFVIPCDLTVHPINLKDGPEIPDVTTLDKEELRKKIKEAVYHEDLQS